MDKIKSRFILIFVLIAFFVTSLSVVSPVDIDAQASFVSRNVALNKLVESNLASKFGKEASTLTDGTTIYDVDNGTPRYVFDTTDDLIITIKLDELFAVSEVNIYQRWVESAVLSNNVKIEVGTTDNGTTTYETVLENAKLTDLGPFIRADYGKSVKSNFRFNTRICDTVRITMAKKNVAQYELFEIEVLKERDEYSFDRSYRNIFLDTTATSNLSAVNRQLIVSSITDGVLDPSGIVGKTHDGLNIYSRFVAGYVSGKPLELEFNLGSVFTIDKIVFYERLNPGQLHTSGELFKVEAGIQIDSGTTIWQSVAQTSLNYLSDEEVIVNEITFDQINANVIRLTLDQTTTPKYNYEIVEVKGFGYINPNIDYEYLNNMAGESIITSNISSDVITTINDKNDLTTFVAEDLEDPLKLTFDMDSNSQINYITINEKTDASNHTKTDKLKVEIGTKLGGGVIWKTLKDNVALNDGVNYINLGTRYGDMIRLTFDNSIGDYSKKLELSEIEIKGVKNPYSTYIDTPKVVTTSNGEVVDLSLIGDGATVDMNLSFGYVSEHVENPLDAKVLVCIYSKTTNQLIFASVCDASLGEDDEIVIANISCDNWGDAYMVATLIDTNSLAPLTNKNEIMTSNLSLPAYDDSGSACKIDYIKNEITINTVIEGLNAGSEVTFLDLNPGYDINDIESVSQDYFGKELAYYVQLTAQPKGKFSYAYKMSDGVTGEHTLCYVNPKTNEFEVLGTYYFYNDDFKNDLVEDFNDATSSEAIRELFETYYMVLGIDTLSGIDTERVSKTIYTQKELAPLKDVSAVIDAYNHSLSISKLNDAETIDEFFELLKQENLYEELTSVPLYEAYENELDSDSVSYINDKILEFDAYHIYDFKLLVLELTALKLVETGSNNTYISPVLESARDYIVGIHYASYDKLKKLGKADSVLNKLIGKSYENIEDFIKSANKIIKFELEKATEEKESSKRPSGNGGGASVPSSPSSVAPTPSNPNAPVAMFTDMSDLPWAMEAVGSLYRNGIINGKTPYIFAPNDNITREEFVKIIVEAFDVEGKANINFDDVFSDAWYKDYVVKAYGANIVTGMSDNLFGIGKNITREDMAVILLRVLQRKFNFASSDMSFTDIGEISAYAKDSVSKLSKAGIINGFSDGNFKAKNNATRAEAAVMIFRAMYYKGV